VDLHAPKKNLRVHYRAARAELSKSDHAQFSQKICDRVWYSFFHYDALKDPLLRKRAVALYFPIDHEVNISFLSHKLFSEEIPIALPDFSDPTRPFKLVRDFSEVRMDGKIPLPPADAKPVRPDIVIVPGVAFSIAGYRLGFGKGFYDQALASGSALKIGVCFQCQKSRDLPVEVHDVRMNLVVTETEILPLPPLL